jgi:hypothetical protein
VGVDDGLHVDLANAFDGADEVGVLTEPEAGVGRFDVLFGVDGAAACLSFAQVCGHLPLSSNPTNGTPSLLFRAARVHDRKVT